jgi:hypothetical protein
LKTDADASGNPTAKGAKEPERRSIGRTRINRSALLFFAGQTGVFSCCVRDVTNQGAGIRLEGLNVLEREGDII